ncbi:MAG: hypothetical protein KBD55_01960 [Candidatus Pacebacteria bacterium]|jgi:hypothetical protein|nr:hypothetical protein [Candidatus Paceibacterota bacterium]
MEKLFSVREVAFPAWAAGRQLFEVGPSRRGISFSEVAKIEWVPVEDDIFPGEVVVEFVQGRDPNKFLGLAEMCAMKSHWLALWSALNLEDHDVLAFPRDIVKDKDCFLVTPALVRRMVPTSEKDSNSATICVPQVQRFWTRLNGNNKFNKRLKIAMFKTR